MDQPIKIEMVCRCCLTADGTFTDMTSAKFQCHDQLLISGYKDLIGEKSSLSAQQTCNSFICLECLEQLENAISFRELCLQAQVMWSSKMNSCVADVQREIQATIIDVPPEPKRVIRRRPRPKNQIYKCALCPGQYRRKRLMEEHVKKHIENRLDPTKVPKEIFFEKYSNESEKSNVIKCPQCDKLFRNVVELNRHVQKHIASKPFECSFSLCSSKFKFEKDFKAHLKTHQDGFPVKCPECPKTFNARKSLIYHQKVHHRSQIETKWYACDVCDKKYTYTAMLFEHTFIHKDHNPYHCPECGHNTSYKTPFKRHLRGHGIEYDEAVHGYVESESHKLPKKRKAFSKKHQCTECGEQCLSKYFLRQHTMTAHFKDGGLQCDDQIDENHCMSVDMDIKIEPEEL